MSELHRISGCDNPSRKGDVVFVHGLGDDAIAAWRHPDLAASDSWPYWLGADNPEIGVWSLDYAAGKSKWSGLQRLFSKNRPDAGYAMALPERARDLLDLMVLNGLGDRPLFFIAHSLGGLVVKQLLLYASQSIEKRRSAIVPQTRAVLFLATPHTGSGLATLVTNSRRLFGATVSVEDLRADNRYLGELLDWYRNHSQAIQTATYYENRDYLGVRIVDRASSHPAVGADPLPLDEDHVSICKPRDRDARVYRAAVSMLQDYILSPPPKPIVPTAPPPASGAMLHLVPHELPPRAKEFFGRHSELSQLIERLQAGENTAVVGAAGMGKTALAAHALRTVTGESAAALSRSHFPDGVVFLDLYRLRAVADSVWNTLADKCQSPSFLERSPARERAVAACHGRRMLIVIEGGEEADGQEGRATFLKLREAFSATNRWLLLTRLTTQAAMTDSVVLREKLAPEDSERLLDTITGGGISAELKLQVLALLEGHPLALTWAGNLLARETNIHRI